MRWRAGQGYIGFSESMRLLKNRAETTHMKSVSFSGQADVRRLYVDAAAIAQGVAGLRYEKCLELNIATVSMRDEFETVYGEGVCLAPAGEEEPPEALLPAA